MAWQKNGTPDTLGSAGDVMSITDLTALKFNVFLVHAPNTVNTINLKYTFNNNTNSVYARRTGENGAADFTNINQANLVLGVGASIDVFGVKYFCSIPGEEKLLLGWSVSALTLGAGTAPTREEQAGKFVPSPDADITRIDVTNTEAGDYTTDSNLSALGTD